MRFPTGGIAREPFWLIRLNSEADGTVRIKEEHFGFRPQRFLRIFLFFGGVFMTKKTDIRKLSVTALFCTIAFLMTFIFRFKVSFLTFDFKDAVIAVAAFLYGPLYGALSAVAVALLEFISVSDTGVYGLIMNALSSVTFALTCGIIYRCKRTFGGAVMAAVFSVLSVTGVMLIANIFITPFYMGVLRNEIIEMIPALLLPFNLAKSLINASATMLIYKPVTTALRRVGLISGSGGGSSSYKTVILTAACIIVFLLTSLFVILCLNGVFVVF